ncbi:restriction endonuclease subunit S [Pseudomonas aeruginosa]|uniref:restriction endonuclease subunit S n=1 Tax=Pseudomonas aeruginosa TaxID=287 RepID=UPI0015569BED|nr:restriction endonuclease subunit S [Pseudomonas aeruginosa]QKF03662.1 restriction endonuclease subunit S [Pseudomonas aeruginosa]
MQSDASWKELNLGDVIELKRGYDLPKGKRSVGVIPIVSSSGISDFHSEAMVKGPGVVTGRYGTIGEVFYIDGDFWPLNTTLYVCDFKGSDPRFISYFLRTLDFQAYSDKGAVPGVNRNHLHTAKVRIPALPVQKAIARILDALDSKIDLNHRINQTLEAMAQAIFKSWFIDFDPVKARIAAIEQGQDPLRAAMRAISGKTDAELDQMPREHHDQLAATAALFSDAMEESELWEIPKGWGIKSVSNIARFATGKIEVSSLTVENYISTENMLENRGGISHASSLPAVATVPTFESGNVLVSNIRPYFKKIWLARFDGGRSNDVLCFEAKEDGCQEFLYNLLYQDIFSSS